VLYTTSVVNTPSRIDIDISLAKERVRNILLDPIQQEARIVLDEIRLKEKTKGHHGQTGLLSGVPSGGRSYLLRDIQALSSETASGLRPDNSDPRG
jgi:hypothetical protein